MRIPIAVAALTSAASWGVAQGPPGTNITVDVRVTAVSMRGDTTSVTHVLTNDPSSVEELASFIVDAPSPVTRVVSPQPQASWFTSAAFGSRSVALWAPLGTHIAAGQASPPLTFEAVGLPAVVTLWLEGFYPPPTEIPSDTLPPADPLVENSVRDTTVGIEPFPDDVSAGNLLLRLRGLLDQTCAASLAWITSATVCASLGTSLDNARDAVAQGNTAGARSQLESFVAEVEAQHGSGLPVNDSAYWLLKVNAEYVVNRWL